MTDMPLNSIKGFTFGCDPEFFVLDAEKRPASPDMIPGDKENPHPVKHGAVQRDGMAAEFNIDPVDNFSDFNRNIAAVMKQLEDFLPEGYTLSSDPSVRFDPQVFEAAPEEAKIMGCSSDFDAWTGCINPPPTVFEDPLVKCAGGHIHIGWPGGPFDLNDEQHVMNCRDLVRQLDWFVGGWSVRLDSNPERRKLYGRAGACRYKPYGVEYRVPSNFWVRTRDRRLAVWNRVQQAIAAMKNGFLPDQMSPQDNATLINYINATQREKTVESRYRYPLVSVDPYYNRGY